MIQNALDLFQTCFQTAVNAFIRYFSVLQPGVEKLANLLSSAAGLCVSEQHTVFLPVDVIFSRDAG